MKKTNTGPKVLVYDIETAPMLAYVWGLWDQNVGLSMIKSDWHILSWSAKWLGEKKVMYADQREAKNIEDDSRILAMIWQLLDEADIVITQNGKKFDQKKLNARFILNGFKPTSPYKHIDTLEIAKKHFKFTSNKLEYMTDKLCKKHKKLTKRKFSGFSLWSECMKGNKKAWKEMEKYNKLDVTSLEELYNKLIPWDNSVNFNLYRDDEVNECKCGCSEFKKKGFAYTQKSKFQRYICTKCGANSRGSVNLFSTKKQKSLNCKIIN